MKERITARVVLLNSENKMLLLKIRSENSSTGVCWLTPGGRMEDGETFLETARRELFEETGITSAEFVTPHSWYSEDVLTIQGIQTFFKEHIFLAYTQEEEVGTLANPDEDERNDVLGFQWWDIEAFRAQGEALFPRGLINYLDPVLYQQNKPSNTIVISL
jgi:8-oxo-dGTP pyrophosphatase MutT (NUDIX family)